MVVARGARADDEGDSRELILRSALDTFAEKGFDGSTTREIATRAGVNHGLIPYYFGSKESLWRDAVDRAFGELATGLEAGLAAVADDPDPTDDEQRMGLLIRNFVRFVARHPEFVRLMHEEGKRPGPRMRWLVDRHVKPLYEGVETLVGSAQARGSLPADVPPIHFHYILAGAVGVIFHQAEECRRLTGIDPFDPEHVEQHARLVERLFLGAVGRSSARPG